MFLFCACGSLWGRKLSTQSLTDRPRKEKKNWSKKSELSVKTSCVNMKVGRWMYIRNFNAWFCMCKLNAGGIAGFVFHQHSVTKSCFFSDDSIFILSTFSLGLNLRFLCTTPTIFIATSNPVGHYPAPHIYCFFFEALRLYMSLNSLFSFSLDVWLPVMSPLPCFVIHKSLRYSLLSLSRKLSQR